MTAEATPVGYTLVLPPGWARIPLRAGTATALDEKVFRGIERIPAGVPRDEGMAFRAEVRRRVEGMAREARAGGGLDLYVPVKARAGLVVGASFVVAEVAGEWAGEEPGAEAVLGRLVGEERGGAPGEVREVAGTLGVRWEYVEPPALRESEPVETYARHVDYVVPVPRQGAGRWLAVAFSTVGDGDPGSEFTRALAELFDALMTTFRWSYA
ncbi:hypothetical protein ACIQCJ_04540 [Streptomyces sp. NPDC093221]|uniref:hypothetical protein n=1 Tax=Streptomyces sp. NPDC093221 TaxID=3366032 RepID=UPI00382EBC6A